MIINAISQHTLIGAARRSPLVTHHFEKDGGNDEEVNCMALCPNCSFTFDLVIKPAIYMAVEKLNNSTVPESWKNGENRKSMRTSA